MKRAAIVCPGRGSYTEQSMGALPLQHPWVQTVEKLRREYELSPLAELDNAERFSPRLHLTPANASALIFIGSMLDSERLAGEFAPVAVLGNSMGWYTALVVAGALDFEDGFRLVQEMALQQERHAEDHRGGQILYPVVDDNWRADPELQSAVAAALEQREVFASIHLGGYEVLAGSERGLKQLEESLPEVNRGQRKFPVRLPFHGPYHTPLVADVARRARPRLAGLRFQQPKIPLVDGRGVRFTPWSTDPEELREYTLGHQVTEPFGFSTCVRVVAREYAPEVFVTLGPGESLAGPIAQVLVAERWGGLGCKADVDRERAEGVVRIHSLAVSRPS